MPQASFTYASAANDAAGLPLSLSVYADRPHLRAQLCEDAQDAGLRIVEEGEISALLDGDVRPLGEIVQLDCPVADGRTLAALTRLDMRAAHCGARLIVSTSIDALDGVFAALDQSQPQILVEPRRAERIVALGHALGRQATGRVREMADEDRLMLLRLSEQVGRIAERIDSLDRGGSLIGDRDDPDGRVEQPRRLFRGVENEAGNGLLRKPKPALPDPRLVRRIIRQRRLRGRFFDEALFADPAWDMLLDLTAARAEHVRVAVTSLCIASGVPPTTALRWIGQMTEVGLLVRSHDESDRRRALISLSDAAADAMARYFDELGRAAANLT